MGVEVFPLTVAFAANVQHKVDAAARPCAEGSQGGAGCSGGRGQHMAARPTVLVLLAQGTQLLGPDGLGSGSAGVRRVAGALRAENFSG